MTLDLRERVPQRRRRAVRARLRPRRDAEPVHPLQRRLPLRRAAPVHAPRSARSGSRPATTPGSSSATARSRSPVRPTPRRTRATCSPPSSPPRSSASGSRSAGRPRRRPARRRSPRGLAGRRPARQPGGLLPRRRRLPRLPRRAAGSSRSPGPIVDEEGRRVGTHDGFWRYTPGQRRGLGVAPAEPLYALSTEAAHEHRRRRPTGVARAPPRRASAAASTGTSRRVQAKLRHRSPAVAATVERSERRLRARPRRAVLRRRSGARRPSSTTKRRRRRRRKDSRSRVVEPEARHARAHGHVSELTLAGRLGGAAQERGLILLVADPRVDTGLVVGAQEPEECVIRDERRIVLRFRGDHEPRTRDLGRQVECGGRGLCTGERETCSSPRCRQAPLELRRRRRPRLLQRSGVCGKVSLSPPCRVRRLEWAVRERPWPPVVAIWLRPVSAG